MKQWSCRINEQGSDGEDVSQEDQQHQADTESKNMTVNQQKEGKSTLESQTVGLTAGLEQQLDQSTCESQHSIQFP